MDLDYCLWDFKISPFEFLIFVKKRNLFDIPPELEWVEKKTESGRIKYYWASNIPEEDLQQFTDPATNVAKSESVEDDALTGKERQELGRLRAEKQKRDTAIKADIEVGQLI